MTMGIRKILLGLCCYLFSAVSASAGPVNGQVAAGSVTIQGQNTPNTTVIQQTPRAIVNWNSFNLGAGESVRFVQPDGSSVILNRVVGNLGPSQIYGTLTANGRVFIVNPDGILIGAGARIDTAGFLASVHDIRNEDFMLGNYRFTIPGRPDASIVNLGTINAHSQGFAALVAPAVRNDGVIVARLGKIALASANEFVLDFYGDRLIQLSVNDAIASKVRDVATGQVLTSLVQNNGKLKANGGQVQLTAVTARQVVDAVVNNRGVIEANTVAHRGGVIILGAPVAKTKQQGAPTQNVVVSGTISAQGKKKNGTGGYIEITGEHIELTSANINASGNIKGGTVLIGGDLSGGQIEAALAAILSGTLEAKAIPAAASVSIDTLSILNASALNNGNGGKIIVWADGTTNFAGLAINRGGNNAGNGGLLEISGKKNLTFAGSVDLRAPNGVTGSLLLDPENVVIGNGPGSTMFVSALQATLANANVVVTTNGAVAGDGDITVAASITWATNNSLTLNAHRNIVINDGVTISNTAAGNLTLNADSQRTGVGYVNFIGSAKIDYSASTGTVEILYNPPFGYSFPINYAPSVLQNIAVVDQFTAYMLVNNVNDLQNIQQNLAGNYALGKDIDATATAAWNGGQGFVPLGYLSPLVGFTGFINGFGHTIDGLTIIPDAPSLSPTIGLVSYLGNVLGDSGKIGNLGLTNVYISAQRFSYVSAGAFAGIIFYGSISNSFAQGAVDIPSGDEVGGLVGNSNLKGLISNSYFSGVVTSNIQAGGIVGILQTSDSVVQYSYSLGTVQGTGILGGLVGYNNGGRVLNSYSQSDIIGGTGHAGGLVGINTFGGLISDSYATGAVTAISGDIGGLVGSNEHQSIWPSVATILRSYATGNVTGTGGTSGFVCYCGGLAGRNLASINQSFSTGDVFGYAQISPIGGGVGGLVGQNDGLNGLGIILQSYATGTVRSFGFHSESVTGGFVGQNYFGTVEEVYATGQVFTNGDYGGLIGWNQAATVNAGYWDTQTTQKNFSEGNATGLTTTQLKSGLPAGFSPSVWAISSSVNNGYPYLRWAFTAPLAILPNNSSPYGLGQIDSLNVNQKNFLENERKSINLIDISLSNSQTTTSLVSSFNAQKINPAAAANILPYAIMAADTYGATSNFSRLYGYDRVTDSNIILNKSDRDLAVASDFYATVFVNRETKELVVAFRGTTNKQGMVEDAVSGMGFVPTSYDLALKFTKLVQSTFTNKDGAFSGFTIVLTGHSLGGGQASYVGAKTSLKSYTFNAARVWASQQNDGKNQTNIITVGDEISAGAAGFGHLKGTTYILNPTTIGTDRPDLRAITKDWQAALSGTLANVIGYDSHQIGGVVIGLLTAAATR